MGIYGYYGRQRSVHNITIPDTLSRLDARKGFPHCWIRDMQVLWSQVLVLMISYFSMLCYASYSLLRSRIEVNYDIMLLRP
jgi:hypothetical protein